MNSVGPDSIQQVLGELRALRSRSALPAPSIERAGGAGERGGFAERLGSALQEVNRTQLDAQQMTREFELGRGDLASTMVAMQKSQLAFRATVEVRNRVVQAYQDIMNMPL